MLLTNAFIPPFILALWLNSFELSGIGTHNADYGNMVVFMHRPRNQHVQSSTNCGAGLIHSCRQREYLGYCRASSIKPDHSIYVTMTLIKIWEGRIFFDGIARVLDGHVTVDFLTNESRFRWSRAVKSRKLLKDIGRHTLYCRRSSSGSAPIIERHMVVSRDQAFEFKSN
jgi:hypothetical protein